MATKEQNFEQTEWSRLCDAVLAERDPQRMSEILDRLLEQLDKNRALRNGEQNSGLGSDARLTPGSELE